MSAESDNIQAAGVDAEALAQMSVPQQEQAIRRLGCITLFRRYAAEVGAVGIRRGQARAWFAHREGITPRSLLRWEQRLRKLGLWGLVDGRGRSGAAGGPGG